MADRTQLGQAAYERQQVFFMDPMLAWEQRLAMAYDEAAAHIRAATPPGTTLDLAQYELAADMAGTQLGAQSDTWMNSFRTDSDSPIASGVKLNSDESRTYYLGHYAQACANIGVFLTGYARELITLGALSQTDFNEACDLRLRAFSDIIYLGRTGQLRPLINAEGWRQEVAPGDSKIVIAKSGTLTGQDAQALQGPQLVALAVVVIVVSAVVAAGYGVVWALTNANNKQRQMAYQACQEALRTNHKDAKAICESANAGIDRSLLDEVVPKNIQNAVLYSVLGGVGIMVLVNFAPDIIRGLSRTSEAYSDVQAARLKRLREQAT